MGSEGLLRRELLRTTSVVAGAGLAGCMKGENGGGGDGNGKGNTLRIAIPEDPGSPLNQYIGWEDWLHELVYDRLLLPSPYVDNKLPGLAKDVTKVSDDAKTWTATIRDGVQWHDGEPFTVEDILFTFRFYRDGPTIRFAHHVSEMPRIEVIERVDETTARFICAFPVPSLEEVTFADLPILPKHIWNNVENPREYQELPVGTGPYKLVDYTQGERYRFKPNKNYFLGEPIIDEIVVPFITDPSVTFTNLKTGEIDSTTRPVPPETVKQFRQDDSLKVVEATTLSSVGFLLNYTKQPFRNHDFRFALSRALDLDAIVDIVMLGEAISGSEGYTHPKSTWTAPDISLPYKPDEARDTFAELGFRDRNGDGIRENPDGDDLSFTIMVPSNEPQFIRASEILARQLGEFGFEIKVTTADPGTIRAEGIWGNQKFDMQVDRYDFHLTSDPDQYILDHGSNKFLWYTKEFPYPEYEKLEEKYIQAETLEEQRSAFHEMNRLYNKQPTMIPLWYSLELQGFRPEAHDKWAEAPPFGIHHKFSFLPKDARGSAITKSF